MSNTRYLEIDSTYRNRNEWPLPGKFEIPISQTGSKNINNALDPVSVSVPLQVWTSNNLNLSNNSAVLTGNISLGSPAFPVGYSSDTLSFIITGTLHSFQKKYNYYRNLVISDITPATKIQGRISEYVFLYSDTINNKDVGQITLTYPFPDTLGNNDAFSITDPSDISDKSNPYIFAPFGRNQSDSYTNLLLYNESVNEYRKIVKYDKVTHMLYLDTKGSITDTVTSGPITSWQLTDNFSMRFEAPYIENNSSITVSAGSTNSTIIISGLSQSSDNYYKHSSIRILPVPVLGIYKYNYSYDTGYSFSLPPPINESSTIVSSSYNNITNLTTFIVSKAFTVAPSTGSLIEIMSFTRDNLYPFVYTGSLVSQQEMVCYEIQLLNLVLPNSILKVGEGGRIAFYPYIYVQLSNVSASGAGLKNIIYSNNPNATNVTFRVPIYDVQNPLISSFVKIDGNGMRQTIKFTPNDTLLFSVTLSNGQVFQTVLIDNLSPALPNPLAQISALFAIKRL